MSVLDPAFKINDAKKLTNPKAIIKGLKYRISVLTPRLIRLEYDETGEFYDDLTELVANRNFPVPAFRKQEDSTYLEIFTDFCTVHYKKEAPFKGPTFAPDSNLRINFVNDEEKYWYYGKEEAKNFKVFQTNFDTRKAPSEVVTKAKKGLLTPSGRKSLFSLDGIAILDDSDSLIIERDGHMVQGTKPRLDLYIFAYGDNFAGCLQDYSYLTGLPPMIPRYALGVWWHKNKNYTWNEIKKTMVEFNKHEIPMNVLLLGEYWHIKDDLDPKKYKSGFTFNRDLLGTPQDFVNYLHERGIRLGLHIDPQGGIYPHETNYKAFATELGIQENQIIPFRVFSKDFMSAYLDKLIDPLHKVGVDFFFIDYKTADTKDLTALTYYHSKNFKKYANQRGTILARLGTKAPHRAGILYTGETKISWDTLKRLPEYVANASNLNVSWISSDIGGFHEGIEEAELYRRFIQYGCFSPILRLASDASKYYKREPWRWELQTYQIVKDYLQLRYKMLPYLYAEAYKFHKLGVPVFKPIYYTNPSIIDEIDYRNEYYLGSELLVAPVTSKKDAIMQRAFQKVFLPQGTWYDFKTGKRFNGNARYVMFLKDEDYPVFARQGSIIPMQDLKENLNDTSCPSSMEIHVFPGQSNTYNLYEDDGVSSLYEQGYYIINRIDYNYLKNNYTLIIRPLEGKSGIIPDLRDYRIKFRNTRNADDVQVLLEATPLPFISYVKDNDFIVEVKQVPTIKQLTIICKGKDIEIDAARILNEEIDSIIGDLPITTELKEELAGIVFARKDISWKRIQIKHLKKKGLNNLFIRMFLRLLEYTKK